MTLWNPLTESILTGHTIGKEKGQIQLSFLFTAFLEVPASFGICLPLPGKRGIVLPRSCFRAMEVLEGNLPEPQEDSGYDLPCSESGNMP